MFRFRRLRLSSPPTSLIGSIPCGSEKNQQFGQSIDWLFAQVMVNNHLKGEIFQAADTIFENQKKHPFLSTLLGAHGQAINFDVNWICNYL